MPSYIEEYKNSPAINQSRLKKLIGFNPKKYELNEEEMSTGFLIGSLVDCIITRPDDFHEEYYVSTLRNIPSDKIIEICKQYREIVSMIGEREEMENDEALLGAIKQVGYQSRWKDKTLLDNVRKDGADYYHELVNAGNMEIITEEQYDKARECASNIKRTFPEVFDNDKIQLSYQVAIYGNYKGHDIKGLLDIMATDYDTKTIDIYDIKTMFEPTIKFMSNLKKYRYDLQMAFYKELVEQNYEGFKVRCHFIVESTETPGTPIMYTCEESLLYIGKFGGLLRTTELITPLEDELYMIEGFDQLFHKLDFYEKNGFDTDLRIVNSKNRVNISWTGSQQFMEYDHIR